MAPASSPGLLQATAVAMAVLLSAAAAAAATPPPAPAPIRQPGCDTTCGNVSVPYPFGWGPSHCYWPGLNLTCDTSRDPPRLLLGDDRSLRVTEICMSNQSVRVVRAGPVINTTGDLLTSDGWNASLDFFGHGFWEHGYGLSSENELVVSGCNVMANAVWDDDTIKNMSGCASFCVKNDDGGFIHDSRGRGLPCTGTSGCCQGPLVYDGVPNRVQARWLYSGNHTVEQAALPVTVFLAEKGWWGEEDNQQQWADDGISDGEVPLLLYFTVKQDLPQAPDRTQDCTQDVQRRVCKSEHSNCVAWDRDRGYACYCNSGYDGNPYIADGCQDIDECKIPDHRMVCFGVCVNTIGSYDCQCPQGTYGDPKVAGGCVYYNFDDTDAAVSSSNCSTRCGDVSVPYPFGFGDPSCYWPGLDLTCDRSHSPPRLLLDGNRNGTLQVVHISLRDSTVRVVYHRSSWVNSSVDMFVGVYLPTDIVEPYMLSTMNEFVVISPCNLRATLYGEYSNGSSTSSTTTTTDSIISQAVCTSSGDGGDGAAGGPPPVPRQTDRGYCSGYDGCCHAPISAFSTPKRVEFEALSNNDICISNWTRTWNLDFVLAFISDVGLNDQWHKIFNMDNDIITSMSSPIVLQWAVKRGLSAPAADNSGKCPWDVSSRLCKSENSDCRQENGGFTCHCSKGYDGNPYVANGCQDIDECNDPAKRNSCLGGYCKNFPGHYECRCPGGMHGDAYKHGGCVVDKSPIGLVIGLAIASGPTLLLPVLGIWFLLRKFKQRRIKIQKQNYFKQNRGQLLQQLLSQKADIAERMIIPLDELAKATNNFDKAREIGGGGHGTVYKGILSDLHVVAIKKSKITMQKEIDEFINEVAILSQINHKNVVKLFGCCLETEVPLLVYEFIPNGTLYHHLHIDEPRSLSWSSRLRIATEIATSLAYLHSSVSIPIIHRDIKSSNILLDDTMTSKISDFGASRYIPIDKTGLTTRIQGTFGYLDPECFYTGRLTDKSDVYSFGVILVELLTRKKPTCPHLSNEGGGLVPHFVNLLASGNLVEVMDPQVLDEGGNEVQEVAMLAASCINLKGDERPTMRQVELTLEGLQQGSNKKYKKYDIVTEEFMNGTTEENYSLGTSEGRRIEECSRRYSLEQEMMISARYPR